MSKHGMADAELEAIELRLIGADHRPWVVTNSGTGELRISIDDKLRRRKALLNLVVTKEGGPINIDTPDHELRVNQGQLDDHVSVFKATKLSDIDACEFVANAPEDIEKLLREVKLQRSRADKLEEKADRLAEDLKAVTRDRDRVTERLRAVVKHWHLFQEALGAEVLP